MGAGIWDGGAGAGGEPFPEANEKLLNKKTAVGQLGGWKGRSYPSLCTKEIPKQQALAGLLFLVLRDRMKATNKNLTTRWFILWLM